jgi:uncharacterized protein (TIGR02284 family)
MSRTTDDNIECISICNSLFRGELSAIETYNKCIEKYPGEPQTTALEKIRDEHVHSANALRENVVSMGGQPDHSSGAWGDFARVVQSAADFFGEASALASLQEGEKYGCNEYEQALKNDEVMPECKDLIRAQLLPKILQHLVVLDSLKKIV